MAALPKTFTESLHHLPEDLGVRGNQARASLARKGFVVMAGLTPAVASGIAIMSQQEHIAEYCPNDGRRFGTENAARVWNAKDGLGRGMFPLMRYAGAQVDLSKIDHSSLDPGDMRMAGYGWTGPEPNEAKITGQSNTFAVRLGAEGRGLQLSVDYATAIVAGSVALYGIEDVGLETWHSNKARKIYGIAGFEFVTGVEDTRPTLTGPERIADTRDYMRYQMELLQQPMPEAPGAGAA